MATSLDGINWTKHNDLATNDAPYGESDPVFQISKTKDAWDSWNITDTNVQRTEDGWAMVYRGVSFNTSGDIGIANSDDGITWHRAAENPSLQAKDFGAPKVYFATYVRQNGKDYIFVEAGSTSGTDVYLATRSYSY